VRGEGARARYSDYRVALVEALVSWQGRRPGARQTAGRAWHCRSARHTPRTRPYGPDQVDSMNPRPRPKGLQGMDAFLLSRFSLHIQNQSLLKPGSLSRFAPPSRRNYSILATRHGCVMSFSERRGIAPGLSAPCGPGLLPESGAAQEAVACTGQAPRSRRLLTNSALRGVNTTLSQCVGWKLCNVRLPTRRLAR